MSSPAVTSAPPPAAGKKSERQWAPRMWIGMCLTTWLGLLVRNRFQISPIHWPKTVSITLIAAFNSCLWAIEQLIFGRAVRRTQVDPRPLIILGHWRSGTTLLHELLALDSQFSSPDTFQAISPNHFLVSRWWATRLFFWLLPPKRPMDNMAVGWDKPQEEEFALANLGERTTYLTIAFPNRPPVYGEYLTLDVPRPDIERWKRSLYGFLQKVTYANPKRLIIKCPPHTSRIRILLEMFPEARFVYIVREPNTLFASTVHLWKSLYSKHGMQVPRFEGLEEYVLETFVRIDDRYVRDRGLIPPGRLVEIKYEDLVRDPVAQTAEIYERLDLGDFARVRGAVEKYVASQADYKTNRYSVTDEQKQTVARRWANYIERYGY
jgi:hypothetical protein